MTVATSVDARREKLGADDARGVLAESRYLYAAKGKKVTRVDLQKTELTEAELLKLVLGPTGNLRAPTLKIGRKLMVGFNPELYAEVLGVA